MDIDQTSKNRLNQSQRTSLSIALRHLETAIESIDQLLDGDRRGILKHTTTDLPIGRREAARRMLTAMRDEIQVLTAEFDLEVEEQNGRRIAVALLAHSWEGLEDARVEKLRRYGAVDATLKDSLDPHIERLINLVLSLQEFILDERKIQDECAEYFVG